MKRYRVKLSAEARQELVDIGVPWPDGRLQADSSRVSTLLTDDPLRHVAIKIDDIARVLQHWPCDAVTGAPMLRGGRD